MPKLGNTVEECILARWRKKHGETVAAGEIIADIETDKATFELTAPVGGTLLEVFFRKASWCRSTRTSASSATPGEPVEQFRPQAAPRAAEPQAAAAPAASPQAKRPRGRPPRRLRPAPA